MVGRPIGTSHGGYRLVGGASTSSRWVSWTRGRRTVGSVVREGKEWQRQRASHTPVQARGGGRFSLAGEGSLGAMAQFVREGSTLDMLDLGHGKCRQVRIPPGHTRSTYEGHFITEMRHDSRKPSSAAWMRSRLEEATPPALRLRAAEVGVWRRLISGRTGSCRAIRPANKKACEASSAREKEGYAAG